MVYLCENIDTMKSFYLFLGSLFLRLTLRFRLFRPIPMTGRLLVSIIIIITWLSLSSMTAPPQRGPRQLLGPAGSTYSPPMTNLSGSAGRGLTGLYFCPITNGSTGSWEVESESESGNTISHYIGHSNGKESVISIAF